MLSAWFKYTDLYLAQGMALLQLGTRPCIAISLPTTLPWDQAFARINSTIEQTASAAPTGKLRVMLSGALCHAISIQAPPEARGWSDLGQLLPLSAAATMSLAPAQLSCMQDAGGEAMGAASSSSLIQAITEWAAQHRLKLSHVQPSWSIASQCKLARLPQYHALQVNEPDGTTLLVHRGDSWATMHIAHSDEAQTAGGNLSPEQLIQHQLISHDINSAQVLRLAFADTATTPLPNGPTLWRKHWREHETTAD